MFLMRDEQNNVRTWSIAIFLLSLWNKLPIDVCVLCSVTVIISARMLMLSYVITHYDCCAHA